MAFKDLGGGIVHIQLPDNFACAICGAHQWPTEGGVSYTAFDPVEGRNRRICEECYKKGQRLESER